MKFAKLLVEKQNNPHAVNPTIAFLGDSITRGCFGNVFDIDDRNDDEAVYHNRLTSLFHAVCPNVRPTVINAGIGGDSAARAYTRLDRDVLSHRPDLVVVAFGVNDVNGGEKGIPVFRETMKSIFAECLRAGVEVIYMTENMMNSYVHKKLSPACIHYEYAHKTAEMQTSGLLMRYFEAGKSAAAECGVPVCDVYAKWEKLAALGIDTTTLLANAINHPTREMHRLFAISLFETIFFAN